MPLAEERNPHSSCSPVASLCTPLSFSYTCKSTMQYNWTMRWLKDQYWYITLVCLTPREVPVISVPLRHPRSRFPVVRIIHRSSVTPQCWAAYRILKAPNTVMSLQSPLSRERRLSWMPNGPQHSCWCSPPPPPGPVGSTTCARRVWEWKHRHSEMTRSGRGRLCWWVRC